jgi:hypothetical protein
MKQGIKKERKRQEKKGKKKVSAFWNVAPP